MSRPSWQESPEQRLLDSLQLDQRPTVAQLGAAGMAALITKLSKTGVTGSREGHGDQLTSALLFPHGGQMLVTRLAEVEVPQTAFVMAGGTESPTARYWDRANGDVISQQLTVDRDGAVIPIGAARLLPGEFRLPKWYHDFAKAFAQWEGFPTRQLKSDLAQRRDGTSLSRPARDLLRRVNTGVRLVDLTPQARGRKGGDDLDRIIGTVMELQNAGWVVARAVPERDAPRRIGGLLPARRDAGRYDIEIRVAPGARLAEALQ